MDIYYTIEEKYLQAVDELAYDTPKSLQLLNEIISNDPNYARAHFQLGMIWYYYIQDYQTAGYHFRLCNEIEPGFPDIYFHYMHLLVFLNMENQSRALSEKAMRVAGVDISSIYNLLGLQAEKKRNWHEAIGNYKIASIGSTNKIEKQTIEESIKDKKRQFKKYDYQLSG